MKAAKKKKILRSTANFGRKEGTTATKHLVPSKLRWAKREEKTRYNIGKYTVATRVLPYCMFDT